MHYNCLGFVSLVSRKMLKDEEFSLLVSPDQNSLRCCAMKRCQEEEYQTLKHEHPALGTAEMRLHWAGSSTLDKKKTQM